MPRVHLGDPPAIASPLVAGPLFWAYIGGMLWRSFRAARH
jgi:hypothetical protein